MSFASSFASRVELQGKNDRLASVHQLHLVPLSVKRPQKPPFQVPLDHGFRGDDAPAWRPKAAMFCLRMLKRERKKRQWGHQTAPNVSASGLGVHGSQMQWSSIWQECPSADLKNAHSKPCWTTWPGYPSNDLKNPRTTTVNPSWPECPSNGLKNPHSKSRWTMTSGAMTPRHGGHRPP